MNSPSPIAISIISHGNADTVGALLNSLQTHEPDSKRFQIILTDNLFTDLPDFEPSPWGSLQVIRNRKQLGFARNHNNAFELTQAKWFAILNPDLVFEHPVFDPLLNRLQAHSHAILAPQVVDENGRVQDSFRAIPTPLELLRRRLPGYQFQPYQPDQNGLIRPDWMAGMFWFMESETYLRLGGMDARYRLYFEDVDFCTRARLAGIEVLGDTHVSIRHDARRASRTRLFYLMLHTQSALRFFTSPVYRQARKRLRSSATRS
jgi:GT2 family glycosyltransferase